MPSGAGPALYFVAYDVLRQILERAADLPALVAYVTSAFRELSGARAVCLLATDFHGNGDRLNLLSVCPERARPHFTAQSCAGLQAAFACAGAQQLIQLNQVQGWRTEAGAPDYSDRDFGLEKLSLQDQLNRLRARSAVTFGGGSSA